ncbi:MAG: indole-3-glycerol phosphate synthase TrpC [Burkholderiales bacterium]
MPNILDEILATKRREVAAAQAARPLAELHALCRDLPPTRDFVGAIRSRHAAAELAVIAEIKRKSPSAGSFRADNEFDPAKFAASYAAHGAACLSVLTDEVYFGGHLTHVAAVRDACSLPILRKDFVVDAYQLVEARAAGADAVLFIVDALPIDEFRALEDLAESLGLAVLVESHTEAQLHAALQLRTPLVGINNRDLTRFVTRLETTLELMPHIPSARIVVAESGVENTQAIDLLTKNGVKTFLVGGALMRQEDPGIALAGLLQK